MGLILSTLSFQGLTTSSTLICYSTERLNSKYVIAIGLHILIFGENSKVNVLDDPWRACMLFFSPPPLDNAEMVETLGVLTD